MCYIDILFHQITLLKKIVWPLYLRWRAFNHVKYWLKTPLPKQRPHDLLFKLWFDEKVYLVLSNIGTMCWQLWALKCIFCYPQFLIFINFCNKNINVILFKIHETMIYWYFLKENLKRHNKLSWHFLKNYVLTFLKFLKINLPARIFLQVM